MGSARIEDGLIVLDVVQQAEGEAACCPSELATRSWSLVGDQLVEGEAQITGKSACNRYSAGVEQGGSPGELKIGPAMGTRMACPGGLMDLEQQYLEALSQVVGFSFRAEISHEGRP